MLLSSLLSALIMWGAIWVITRREGHVRLGSVLLVSAVTCAASYLAFRFLGGWGLPVVLVGLVFQLVDRCFLSLPAAILVALLWLAAQIGFALAVGPVF